MSYEEHCLLMKKHGKQPYTREEFYQKRLDTLEKSEYLKPQSGFISLTEKITRNIHLSIGIKSLVA